MSQRAQAGGLATAETFVGSHLFPPGLVRPTRAHDPKAALFGATEPVPALPLRDADRDRVRQALERRGVRGKRLLLCSGGRDQLVPYAVGKPVVDVLIEALRSREEVGGWYGGTSVDSKVYEDVGHAFSKDMVTDAVAFLVEAIARGPRERDSKPKI